MEIRLKSILAGNEPRLRFDIYFLLKATVLTRENIIAKFIAPVRVARAPPETSDMRQHVKWP